MPQAIARYATSFGLSGCYLPDDHGAAVEFTRRRDLANFIRDELRMYDMPASLFREVRINRLWSFIKSKGSSCAHFRLCHKGHELAFHGLTEDEYLQQCDA
ncbi:MAG: hypothetical protein ING31_10425 [Burkholderiales bacterium]|nr:hypothetical protein [Burkholderiales bacterium]